MDKAKYDAIVVGLGAMGSAAAYQLAKRGARVLGLDRYMPPHIFGSSHGDTRLTRLAIGEGSHYVPLVKRSHEIWREIEGATGENLLTVTGGLIISSKGPTAVTHVEGFFENTVAVARAHDIDHEMLDASAIRARFPPFKVRDDEIGYYEKSAGFVQPEACIRAQLALAARSGAVLRTGESALGFDADTKGVTVRTEKGSYRAEKILLTAGPWLPNLLSSDNARCFKIFRQVLFWFEVGEPTERFKPGKFPVFIWALPERSQGVYGFPSLDGTSLKIATEQHAATSAPEDVDRNVSEAEIAAMHRDFIVPHFSGIGGRCAKSVVCLYTVTPDAGFVIDILPGNERVIVASACSGHGFKHSAAIGEALSQLALDGRSHIDLGAFRWSRFG